jgi:hypothetical protein
MPFIKVKEGPEQRFYRELYEKLKENNDITYIKKKKIPKPSICE